MDQRAIPTADVSKFGLNQAKKILYGVRSSSA